MGWITLAIQSSGGANLQVIKLARLFRVLRPLRSLSVVPMLREVIDALLLGLKDLQLTFFLIMFFMLTFAIFLVSLLSSALRYR